MTIPGDNIAERSATTARNANMASELLNAGLAVDPSDIVLYDQYIGPESWGTFKRATEKGIEAVRLAAKCEGVLLDPHYTGKAMAALIDDIRGPTTGELLQ